MIRKFLLIFVCAVLLSSCASIPKNLKVEPPDHSLAQRMGRIIQKSKCRMGVAAVDLKNGRTVEWNATGKFESASVIKIAILAEALSRWHQGKLDLNARWFLSDQAKAAGSGVLDAFDPGLQPTNRDLLRLMIIVSDNTATNHWIDVLDFDQINRRMEQAGLPEIRLVGNKLPNMNPPETESARWKGLRFGEVTPRSVAAYFRLLYRGELLDPEGTKIAREIFSQQHFTSRIPRRLLDEADHKWEGKTGTMSGVVLDCGILTTPKGTYALAIFADHLSDATDASDRAIEAIGDLAYEIVTAWEK